MLQASLGKRLPLRMVKPVNYPYIRGSQRGNDRPFRSGECDRTPETPQLGDVEMFPSSDLATHESHGNGQLVGCHSQTLVAQFQGRESRAIARSGDVGLPGLVRFVWWGWVKERSPIPVNNQLSRTDRTVLKTAVIESDSEALLQSRSPVRFGCDRLLGQSSSKARDTVLARMVNSVSQPCQGQLSRSEHNIPIPQSHLSQRKSKSCNRAKARFSKDCRDLIQSTEREKRTHRAKIYKS